VVLLRAGNRIPADARIAEAVQLEVQEAALTGESVPVEKHAGAVAVPDLAIGDRRNMAHAGTLVTRGRGQAVVVATGMRTEFGRVAELLQTVDAGRTPLQESLDRLGATLARVALVVVAAIVALGLVREQPFLDMLVFGIALAVAVVPEALPAVVTISLALGVQRLVRRGALMRRLAAVETLGSTSVICSDKTGTLTRDEMTARQVYVGGTLVDVSGAGYAPEGEFLIDGVAVTAHALLERLLHAAVLSSDARVVDEEHGRWRVQGDPTEGALVVAAAKAGLDKPSLDARFPRVHEIPFSPESRRMTTLHSVEDEVVAFAKGAPEDILATCATQVTRDGEVRLDEAGRAAILAVAGDMAARALRVLAVATRAAATPDNAERDLAFLGLIGMIDPPRAEAKAAIATCEAAGIRVVMITGDHPVTARAVAGELGLLKGGRVATGAEVEAMDDAALRAAVDAIEVYARVSPAHKLRIVTALQARGHVVAMTGDGVNDAPALKRADIGVAMGITGTDVAKEAAAMTLTNDDFASIVAAVDEGRGIFANIRKYLVFLLSSNTGEIGLMAGASLFGLPLPLTAVQILYVNLATDGLPALALAVDPADPHLMRRRPRDPRAGIFTRPVVALVVATGLWSTVANLGVFAWSLRAGRPVQEAMALTFVTVVLIQFFNAFSCRSDRTTVLRRPFANRWLNLAVLWELGLLALVVQLPWLQRPFQTAGLGAGDWVTAAVVAVSILPVAELVKAALRRGWFSQPPSLDSSQAR
jgi:Ca2+-transporting ATPase